jgi:hypothetical protein
MDALQLSNQELGIIAVIAIWDFIWRGIALWKAGRNNDKLWFILLLVLNTAGILPIVYIFIINKGKSTKKE